MKETYDDPDEITLASICKSSTDDFLQCEAMDVTQILRELNEYEAKEDA